MQLSRAQNMFEMCMSLFHFSGCLTGIAPHLSELIPFLINSLSEKRVSVNSITAHSCLT